MISIYTDKAIYGEIFVPTTHTMYIEIKRNKRSQLQFEIRLFPHHNPPERKQLFTCLWEITH